MKAPLFFCAAVVLCNTSIAADKKAAESGKAAPTIVTEAAPAAAAGVKDVTPDEAEKIIKSKKDVVVLDVRTPEEFESGHITGAQNVDAQSDEFLDKLTGLDKNKTYVLHCASGGRSSRVLKRMRELDFKSIYHMSGGISAWKEAGKPLEK